MCAPQKIRISGTFDLSDELDKIRHRASYGFGFERSVEVRIKCDNKKRPSPRRRRNGTLRKMVNVYYVKYEHRPTDYTMNIMGSAI